MTAPPPMSTCFAQRRSGAQWLSGKCGGRCPLLRSARTPNQQQPLSLPGSSWYQRVNKMYFDDLVGYQLVLGKSSTLVFHLEHNETWEFWHRLVHSTARFVLLTLLCVVWSCFGDIVFNPLLRQPLKSSAVSNGKFAIVLAASGIFFVTKHVCCFWDRRPGWLLGLIEQGGIVHSCATV